MPPLLDFPIEKVKHMLVIKLWAQKKFVWNVIIGMYACEHTNLGIKRNSKLCSMSLIFK